MTICNFSGFYNALLDSGFSLGGGNDKGIYAVIPHGWEDQPSIGSTIRWHTGDPDTDPWEWRMRVLEERDDIAYSKVFFRTSGYITKEWYPYFYAIRRKYESFEDAYHSGTVSQFEKLIYQIISKNGETALHEIKQLGGFAKEDNSKFERAMVDLQMGMFITICGRNQKVNKYGERYGWSSTVFTTVEDFWQVRGYDLESINPDEAYEKIKAQILELNPGAELKKINKFIWG
ncbi:MAG: hypothetical protein GX815_00710 [Clostridiales bacterium]|jgi:hypothetical protein|nr:hypothetical protein [Clostridiales bacterium]